MVVVSKYAGGTSILLVEVVGVVVVVLEIYQYRVSTLLYSDSRGNIWIDWRHFDTAGTETCRRAVTA